MTILKLDFVPGVDREGTNYSAEGKWFDCDKIRFRSGKPEKIGGWQRLSNDSFLGVGRSMHAWASLAGADYVGIGTNLKYYIEFGGSYTDITPIRKVSDPLGANPIQTAYSTLAADANDSQGTLTLTSAASFPSTGGIIQIGTEEMTYSSVSGNTLLGVTRGYNGTTPAAHLTGANVASSTITITDSNHGAVQNDFVTIANATAVGGFAIGDLNAEHQIYQYIDASNYSVNIEGVFSTSAAAGGGSIVSAEYQVNTGLDVYVSGLGWGSDPWGAGGWGSPGTTGVGQQLRLWAADNYGEDLVFNQRSGPIFYWDATTGLTVRGKYLSEVADATTLASISATFGSGATSITVADSANVSIGAYITGTGLPAGTQVSNAYIPGSLTVPITTTTTASSTGDYLISYSGAFVPHTTNQVITAPTERFVIAMGANSYDPGDPDTPFDPMLVRWADQEDANQWVPAITNQSGEFRLSRGSYIVAALATRQEILIWTDAALYSMQYVGPPYVWSFQLLADNISVMSPQCMKNANNLTFWMGTDKFYVYSGRTDTLPSALRQYIFSDINRDQAYQIFAGKNEGYNEIWWFYCPEQTSTVSKYVVFNYADNAWYYGSLERTAWLDSPLRQYPMAIGYNNRIIYHEIGTDDLAGESTQPISAYIQSADFDIGDGDKFAFVWRILPDINFTGSYVDKPSVIMTLKPRRNAGAPYGVADQPVVQSQDNYINTRAYTIQEFDGQVYTRLRGRQMALRVESSDLGVSWQLGSVRADIRPDGRR